MYRLAICCDEPADLLRITDAVQRSRPDLNFSVYRFTIGQQMETYMDENGFPFDAAVSFLIFLDYPA